MKEEILKNFTKDINDIREYLKYIELVNDIQTSEVKDEPHLLLKNHLHEFGVTKKIFEYKSITISLYGILEKHVGIWVEEYIERLQNIVSNYKDLSPKFQEFHFNLSVKLIGLISEKKHAKYEKLNKEKILEKLNSCIKTPSEFQLNSDAFYIQSGNLKHAKIAEILDNLDIKLTNSLKIIGSRKPDGFLNHIPNVSNTSDTLLFGLIDDLVVRRNDIAHGQDIDQLISITEFNEYIDFLEHYGKAILQTFSEKINQLESENLYQKIDTILGIFQGGTVLCFEINNNEISVGDFIIVNLGDGGFIRIEVEDIQVDRVSHNTFSTETSQNIGIKVSQSISPGQTFFIKRKRNAS